MQTPQGWMEPDGAIPAACFQVQGDLFASPLSCQWDFVGEAGRANHMAMDLQKNLCRGLWPVKCPPPGSGWWSGLVETIAGAFVLMGLLRPPCIAQVSLVPSLMEGLLGNRPECLGSLCEKLPGLPNTRKLGLLPSGK